MCCIADKVVSQHSESKLFLVVVEYSRLAIPYSQTVDRCSLDVYCLQGLYRLLFAYLSG